MRWARRMLFAGALATGVAMLLLVFARVGERGRFAAAYSTYGAGAEGTRALFLLAEARGARPVRWSEDLGRLPRGGMLVVLGGCDSYASREPSRFEQETLRKWVEAGGVLLVAGARDFLDPKMGLSLARRAEDCEPRFGLISAFERASRQDDEDHEGTADPEEGEDVLPTAHDAIEDPNGTADRVADLMGREGLAPAEWTKPRADPLLGLAPIALREPGEIVVKPGSDATTLLEGAHGIAALVQRRGRGHVIVIASASLLQNRELGTSEGGIVFARLVETYAPRGPILFDEYHVGVGERRSLIRYLGQIGVVPFLLQVFVVIAFGLWRAGSRLGTVAREPATTPAGTASFVDAIGDLYARTKDTSAILDLLIKRAVTNIAAHHHVPVATPEQLASVLAASGRTEPAHATAELAEFAKRTAEQFSSRRVTDRGLLVHAASQIDLLVHRATGNAPPSRPLSR